MNRGRYQLVFSRARGCLVAVGEGARRAGKRASGQASRASVALAALLLSAAHAQIVADPAAPCPQRATVLAAPNGVPLVNITTPSAAGVSRNTWRQFDVGAPGASRDAEYLARTDRNLLQQHNFDMDHVLAGEINAAGKATGYHAEFAADGAARIKPGATVTHNANGTYEAPVQVFNAGKGIWVDKVRESTFFPPSWSQARIEYEITEAFKQGTPGTRFEVASPSGITIRFSWDAKNQRTTFYPLGKP
jgi:hypothetical protein